MPVPNAFSTASLAANRAAMWSYELGRRRQYSSSAGVNTSSRTRASSLARRATRATATMSTPVRTRGLAGRGTCTLLHEVGQVLDREVVDDLLGPELPPLRVVTWGMAVLSWSN